MGLLSNSWVPMDGISRYDVATNTVEAYTPHVIPQLVGYIKYVLKDEVVVFRGQRNNYANIIPSLYRPIDCGRRKLRSDKKLSTASAVSNSHICHRKTKELKLIEEKLKTIRAFIPNTDDDQLEAIMQHYGFNTRYIDFVDNIWVALMFSVLSFKLSSFRFSDEMICFDSNGYGYIYVLSLGRVDEEHGYSVSTSKGFKIIDLRKVLPSLYLRPHAQHGLLARKSVKDPGSLITTDLDMIGDVVVKIKIKKSTTIKWINNSKVLSPSFLFPHMYFDHGYATLASINVIGMFNELIHEHQLPYTSPVVMFDHFGCVKLYTYEQAESDYSEYISQVNGVTG